MRRELLFLVPLLLALHAGAASVSTYNTFGQPGNTYNAGAGWLVNGSAHPPQPYVGEAFAFTPSVSGYLSQLNLAISSLGSDLSNNLASVFVAANNNLGNVPGTTLESFLNLTCPGPFGANNPILSLTSTQHPILWAGNTYWLFVRPALPTAAIVVNQNDQGILAPQAQESSPGSWTARGSKTTFAFEVEVYPVPEPSVMALALLGLAVLGRLGLRRHSSLCQSRKTRP